MKKYTCHICKKKHSVYYSSTGGIPTFLLDIRIKEEFHRVEELSTDFLLIDKENLIIKGNIIINTEFTENPMFHEAWISIPINSYVSQVELIKNQQTLELTGEIASKLPFYPNIVGLAAKWIFSKEQEYARIEIIAESQLKNDQSQPISKDRVIEIMQQIHHPELFQKKTTYDKPFLERFNQIISRAQTEYSVNSKFFLINISNLKEVVVQLISSEMLSKESSNEIGIHLSNDEANDNFQEVQDGMADIYEDLKFRKFELDGIETYQKKYKFDDRTLISAIKMICESVYGQNIDELDIEIMEM